MRVTTDVNSSVEIEIKLKNMYQFFGSGEKYPQILESMTEVNFQNWKNSYLQESKH